MSVVRLSMSGSVCFSVCAHASGSGASGSGIAGTLDRSSVLPQGFGEPWKPVRGRGAAITMDDQIVLAGDVQ